MEAVIPQEPAATNPAPTRAQRVQAWLAFWLVAVAAVLAVGLPQQNTSAPGGFLFDAEGRPASLGERLAPVTLVHFWATWCPPCLTETPSLTRLSRDVTSMDFTILFVAVNDDVGKVQEFLGTTSEGVLFDPNWEVAHRYDTYKLPETVVLVGNKVVDKFIGAQDWDSPEVRQRLVQSVRLARPEGLEIAAASIR